MCLVGETVLSFYAIFQGNIEGKQSFLENLMNVLNVASQQLSAEGVNG